MVSRTYSATGEGDHLESQVTAATNQRHNTVELKASPVPNLLNARSSEHRPAGPYVPQFVAGTLAGAVKRGFAATLICHPESRRASDNDATGL